MIINGHRHSKYYIPRGHLNTMGPYFNRVNLSDKELIQSAKGLTDIARKRLSNLRKSDISPKRYSFLEYIYGTRGKLKRESNGMVLTDKERRQHMYYINAIEEVMFERHTTVREIHSDMNRAIKSYNKSLGINLNKKQYDQLIKIIDVLGKAIGENNVDSETVKSLAIQYDGITNGQHTLSKKNILKVLSAAIDKKILGSTNPRNKKKLQSIKEELGETYDNIKRSELKGRNRKPIKKVSKGDKRARKKHRRFER